MEVIGVDAASKLAQFCVACLSSDRKLFPLTSFGIISHKIFKDIGLDTNGPENVCWECKALIVKYTRFYDRVQKAKLVFDRAEKSLNPAEKLSTLSSTIKNHFDAVFNADSNYNNDGKEHDFHNEINPLEIETKEKQTGVGKNYDIEIKAEIEEVKSEINEVSEPTEELATHDDVRIKQEVPIDYDEPIQELVQERFPATSGVSPYITLIPTTSIEAGNSPKPLSNKLYLTIPKENPYVKVFDGQFNSNEIGKLKTNIGTSTQSITKPMPNTSTELKKFETVYITDKELTAYLEDLRTKRNYIVGTLKCEDCIVAFTTTDNLEKHMELHRPDRGPHACPICKQRFGNLMNLYHHNQDHYKLYKCADCAFRTHLVSMARSHWRLKHNTEKVCCKKCDAQLPPGEMKKHYMTAHLGILECNICGNTCKTKSSLAEHMKYRHKAEEMPKVECKICQKLFFPKYMRAHVRNVHGQDNSEDLYCADCNIKFKTKLSYRMHMKKSLRHIQPDSLRYECDYCQKKFVGKSYMSVHIEECHLRIPRYPCESAGCQWLFVSQRLSRRHFLKIHSDKPSNTKKYVCDICGKEFTIGHSLKEHMNLHTGERPFKCDKCDATFMYSAALFTHNKLVHLKIKRPSDLKKLAGRRKGAKTEDKNSVTK